MVCESEIENGTMRVNCLGCVYGSSIEDFEACMATTIDKLSKNKGVSRIVLAETRENEYDPDQTQMLMEIANAFDRIVNEEKLLSLDKLGPPGCESFYPRRLSELQFLVLEVLRKDPVGAYVRLSRMITREKSRLLAARSVKVKQCHAYYVQHALVLMSNILGSCKLVQLAKPMLKSYNLGDRAVYRDIFHPIVRPNFMLTRYMLTTPKGGRLVEKYYIGNTLIEIFRIPGQVRCKYHMTPIEFKLTEEKYTILDAARRYLTEHRPSERETTEPESAREIFKNIGRDLVSELARRMNVSLDAKEIEELATILTRYTAGFGVLELLLSDDRLQDIYINSPIGLTPIYIYHSDFEECETNLIPTKEDAEAWATRFRLYSGRPLDEANPVLDTELLVPGGRARVAAITRTLSPEGLAFAFRRHRERPWTLPLFLKVKYFDPLYAGLMSFIVDGGRACLIAGGRSSGKTSLLGALMLEVMRKFRVICQEDSVSGDSRVVIEKGGKFERTTVGKLIDGQLSKYGVELKDGREILRSNPENIKVFSLDSEGNVKLSPAGSFIRHKVSKDMFEVETRTGRLIKVTGDHSLFSLSEDGKVMPIKTRELKQGDHIVTPRYLPIDNKGVKPISILDHLEKLSGFSGFIVGPGIRNLIDSKRGLVKEVAIRCGYKVGKEGYPKSTIQNWRKKGALPSKVLNELLKQGCKVDDNNLKFKIVHAKPIPTKFELDEDFLTFVGLWLADGCYDGWGVIISLAKDETSDVIYRVGEKVGLKPRMHSDGFSLMFNSKSLKVFMQEVLELRGYAYTKTAPNWVYGLSKDQMAFVLKGIFSGDGYLAKDEAAISLVSLDLIKDIQTLLLAFGIVSRINRMSERDKTYSLRISAQKTLRPFFERIGFLQKERMKKLDLMCRKISTHDTTDIVPLTAVFKKGMTSILPPFIFNKHDYVTRNNNIGREKLREVLSRVGFSNENEEGYALQSLETLANSDIFWDEVRSVRCLGKTDAYVYDFSVPDCENFICENILAHNTLELPVVQMRKLGYNIERLKSRSVITHIETELPADEALRTALRLGDSVLILGEVRSLEGKALFEAMRIGALAHFVGGTIHAESPYGVYDRVVNDLGVPNTSFKAVDLITICNMLRSPDGLHRFRRVTSLTEVRKHWKEDPNTEGGFVDLMEYSARDDMLKPTPVLIDGESEMLNEIAKRVREWHGRWEDVWDNILLRAKLKESTLSYAEKLNKPEILEAEWVIDSNEMFHIISDKVKEEVGGLDSKIIYERWEDWFKSRLKED